MQSGDKFILHIVPKSHRGSYGAGQWKDIESFNELLRQVGFEFELVEFELTKFDDLLKHCKSEGVTDIILYYQILFTANICWILKTFK